MNEITATWYESISIIMPDYKFILGDIFQHVTENQQFVPDELFDKLLR